MSGDPGERSSLALQALFHELAIPLDELHHAAFMFAANRDRAHRPASGYRRRSPRRSGGPDRWFPSRHASVPRDCSRRLRRRPCCTSHFVVTAVVSSGAERQDAERDRVVAEHVVPGRRIVEEQHACRCCRSGHILRKLALDGTSCRTWCSSRHPRSAACGPYGTGRSGDIWNSLGRPAASQLCPVTRR